MYVVLESYLSMVCDSPRHYLGAPGFDFLAAIPTSWDETRVPAAKINEYVAIARRKGNVWYVSAIGSWDKQELELPLPFLGEGEWNAEIFEDGVNADRDATDYVRRAAKVTSASKLSVKLAPGGGFTARISKDGSWTESLKFWK